MYVQTGNTNTSNMETKVLGYNQIGWIIVLYWTFANTSVKITAKIQWEKKNGANNNNKTLLWPATNWWEIELAREQASLCGYLSGSLWIGRWDLSWDEKGIWKDHCAEDGVDPKEHPVQIFHTRKDTYHTTGCTVLSVIWRLHICWLIGPDEWLWSFSLNKASKVAWEKWGKAGKTYW